ncbi:centlein-like isoform X1 [Branchiostoma floridae]|uniref:Centlein-like isoform X1 n=1 Tax=Branchiostoma floridae TaxID=7739 RepID=A0A9J7HXX5_BRAFL|nr:centlein-like isoform X1 [Branchiostoma floridae]XP_035666091.1 centlein-like isoform X2 [Branchiostoma floridae]XP_035666092.1 centlein-like isoform X3 [Branchiostoma floridae]XP_035666093.1 centlein-like isoform X4 [Branchiostoma floridae]XP_035666094.1 centlein-like isoform X1 [Branchiostoma floridae]
MDLKDAEIARLKAENEALADELSQCQADKEFVWSLWKRLQVASPDITQAISQVIQREKEKAEIKDRKVLDILQTKDNKIHELEETIATQQRELNSIVQRKLSLDEEKGKLQADLKEVKDRNNFLENMLKSKERKEKENEEHSKTLVGSLEQEKEELNRRLTDLIVELETDKEEKTELLGSKTSLATKIKVLEDEVRGLNTRADRLTRECADMKERLTSSDRQLEQKNRDLDSKTADLERTRKDLADLQNTHRLCSEQAAQQAELIRQLQALQLDTQKVLRNQEDAHNFEATSYQKMYAELSVQFNALQAAEVELRQQHQELVADLRERDELILELRDSLNISRNTGTQANLHPRDQDTQVTTGSIQLECRLESQETEIQLLKDKLRERNRQLKNLEKGVATSAGTSPLQRGRKGGGGRVPARARSLSPNRKMGVIEQQRRLDTAEKKAADLLKKLKLKDNELSELKKAHDNRLNRLRALQSSHRILKEQVKTYEEHEKSGKRAKARRSDPRSLQQEDSDTVWNELTYFRQENKKLMLDRMNLQEEVDLLKVQVSQQEASVNDLTNMLQQEREELMFQLAERDLASRSGGHATSTPRKKSVADELQEALRKNKTLEKRLKNLEKENKELTSALEEDNRKLTEDKESLVKEKRTLRNEVNQLRKELSDHREETENLQSENSALTEENAELQAEITDLKSEISGLKSESSSLKAEAKRLKSQMQSESQKNKQAQQKMRVRLAINSAKTSAKSSVKKHQKFLNKSIEQMSELFDGFEGDEWEEMSTTSANESTDELTGGEMTGESLGQLIVSAARSGAGRKTEEEAKGSDAESSKASDDLTAADTSLTSTLTEQSELTAEQLTAARTKHRPGRKLGGRRHAPSPVGRGLKQRVASLQQQVATVKAVKEKTAKALSQQTEANEQLQSDLGLANQRLKVTRQTVQKLTTELEACQSEKAGLEKQLAELGDASITSAGSQATKSHTQADWRHLENRVRTTANEVSRQSDVIKALRSENEDQAVQLRTYQERCGRLERDVTMKRTLIEDMKLKVKMAQENAQSDSSAVQQLEERIKALSLDSEQKKTQLGSLKRRIAAVTKDKYHYEQLYFQTQQDLEKKTKQLQETQTRRHEAETVVSELESAAAHQLQGLATKSELAIEAVETKLNKSQTRVGELNTFVKALSAELLHQVQSTRRQVLRVEEGSRKSRERERGQQDESLTKAQSLACSILNISQADMEDIMNPEEEAETGVDVKAEKKKDQQWNKKLEKVLSAKVPFATSLLELVVEKMEERVDLVERLYKTRGS